MNAFAVRPSFWLYPQFFYHIRTRPLEFLSEMAQHGPLVQFQVAPGRSIYLVSDPEWIRDILVTRAHYFHKGRALNTARRLLGNGLLTSEGQEHRQQRQLMQPVFHRQRVEALAPVMLDEARQLSRSWHEGQEVRLLEEMHRLTLRIVTRTLFDSNVDLEQARVVRESLDQSRHLLQTALLPFFGLAEKLLPGYRRRFEQSRGQLDGIVYALIEDHRRNPRPDLLSLLIDSGMSDEEVRDQALTIFLAGHETTASSLAWTLYLLGAHATVQTEVAGDGKRLEPVILESLRLYPPAWAVGRQAVEDFQLGAELIRRNSTLLVSPFVMQRDERWFPQPLRFQPERWDGLRSRLPRYAFFPFGGGPRVCIGEHFSMMEMQLVLAELTRDWRFELVSELPPRMEAVLTMRPAPEVPVRVYRRA